jgi:hypothetical protein
MGGGRAGNRVLWVGEGGGGQRSAIESMQGRTHESLTWEKGLVVMLGAACVLAMLRNGWKTAGNQNTAMAGKHKHTLTAKENSTKQLT